MWWLCFKQSEIKLIKVTFNYHVMLCFKLLLFHGDLWWYICYTSFPPISIWPTRSVIALHWLCAVGFLKDCTQVYLHWSINHNLHSVRADIDTDRYLHATVNQASKVMGKGSAICKVVHLQILEQFQDNASQCKIVKTLFHHFIYIYILIYSMLYIP